MDLWVVPFRRRTASLEPWHTASVFRLLLTTPRGPQSDAEGGKGLHQGDLGARVGFAPAAVPVATPARQRLVPVPLLPPLLVADLWESGFICFVFFSSIGLRLVVFSPAFI